MAFWGVEVKPGKPYAHVHDGRRGVLRVSQATLGDGTATKRSVVQCNVGNKSPVLLCSLLPDKSESCCLDLQFEEDDEVVFSVIGPRSVHLTGYFLGESNRGGDFTDDSDSYEEDIWEMGSEESDSYSGEDDYMSDFIDDSDIGMAPSTRPGSGVVIEEIVEDEKPSNGNANVQRLKDKHQEKGSDDGDVGAEHRIILKHNKTPILESEDEDGFPISVSKNGGKNNVGDRKLDDKTSDADRKRKHDVVIDKGSEKSKRKKKSKVKSEKSFETDNTLAEDYKNNADDESNVAQPCKGECEKMNLEVHSHEINTELTKKKKGLEGDAPNDDELDKAENSEEELLVKSRQEGLPDKQCTIGSSIPSTTPDPDKSKRKKKKRTKDGSPLDNRNKSAGTLGKDGNVNSNGMNVNNNEHSKPLEKIDEDQPVGELSPTMNFNSSAGSPIVDALHDVKKKQKKKQKACENDSTLVKKSKPRKEALRKPRTYANGLVIEEISMGQPDGKRADPGKTVSLHYIGKLRNGKIFDSNIGQKPFKFRLGVGQVIKGWDVGVDGMRIGDKRRLTIPPSMGYGEKGAGGVIPGNAWLVFDVELVDVK